MLAAIETQCREGGNAFADYAGWISQGIAGAAMGEEETVRAMAVDKNGGIPSTTGLNELYVQTAQQTPGFYMGVTKDGDRVVTHIGIDFQTADQNALVNAGMVSGDYRGNMADGWLSLAATVGEFEKTA